MIANLEQFEEEQATKAVSEYKTSLVSKMHSIVQELFSILDTHLAKMQLTEEDKVFIAKTKADYSRYMAEVDPDMKHKDNSSKFYEEALSRAGSLQKNDKT